MGLQQKIQETPFYTTESIRVASGRFECPGHGAALVEANELLHRILSSSGKKNRIFDHQNMLCTLGLRVLWHPHETGSGFRTNEFVHPP